MLSLFSVIWAWVAESASLLMDLANAGRDAGNPVVIAIVVAHAVIRVAAFLIFTIPALVWLKSQIWPTRERKGKDGWIEETGFRAIILVLIVLSLIFEATMTPTRPADGSPDAAITEGSD